MIDAVNSLSSIAGTAGGRSVERLSQTILAPGAQAPQVSGPQAAGADFGRVMADVAAKGVDALRSAEAASIAGIDGKASVQQVVEAVMNAERTLQTAVAVRDKVVQAYQEISRMQI